MSNHKKKKSPKSIFSSAAGCGGCSKPKLSDIIELNAKPTTSFSGAGGHNPKPRFSSSSSGDGNDGVSLEDEDCACTATGILTVEKDSEDPYEDFRNSMLQMIMEKRIYSTNGLQELLNCFLHLNSPTHHEIIVKAFTQIWNEFISHSHYWISNSDRKPPPAGEV